MATTDERLRKSSRMQKRMSDDGSNDGSCVDLYADVERNFRLSSSSRPARSPLRSSSGKDDPVSSRSVRCSKSPVPKENLSNSSRTSRHRQDSTEDVEKSLKTRTSCVKSKVFDVTRKDSLNSESSDGTKPIEYEYEVSSDDSPSKNSKASLEVGKENKKRSASPKRFEASQHSVAMTTGSLKGKVSESNSRNKGAERKSVSERNMRSSGNRSGTGSRSPKRSSKSSHSSKDLREHLKEQERKLERNSCRERSRCQNEEEIKSMDRSKNKERTRSKSRSGSYNREQNERSSHKLNFKDGRRSQSPTRSNDSPRSSINIPPVMKKQSSEKTRNIWSSSMGYVSKSSPTLRSSQGTSSRWKSDQAASSQRDVGEKSKKSRSEKEKVKQEKQKKLREQRKPDKPEKTKKSPVPLTTRGWRAQLAAKFGRSPSEHGSIKSRGRIPSTLVFDGSQCDDIPDDISEIP